MKQVSWAVPFNSWPCFWSIAVIYIHHQDFWDVRYHWHLGIWVYVGSNFPPKTAPSLSKIK
jgi:hypothetical protein